MHKGQPVHGRGILLPRVLMAAGLLFMSVQPTFSQQARPAGNTPIPLGGVEPVRVEGRMRVDRAGNGQPINIGELTYAHGVGVSTPSRITYRVPAGYGRFEAWAGADVTSSKGEGRLRVRVDGEATFDSGRIRFAPFSRGPGINPPRPVKVTVPVDGAKTITLLAKGEGASLHADWAAARFVPADWPAYRPRKRDPALAATPPMGWNSWNAFGRDIDGRTMRQIVDAMIEKGFREAGYSYLNLDDGWQAEGYRNEQGAPLFNKQKFPKGMKALGRYIHGKGLKFGIYSRPDWVGGQRREGLWTGGHELKHARAFARWGVDYLKYDFGEKMAFYHMAQALKQVDRPIFYNVCGWGKSQGWQWAYHIGAQSWRTTYDVMSAWHTGLDRNPVGVMDAVDQTEALGPWAGPGQWNDPDMLIVGLEGGTAAQSGHQDKVTSLNATEQRSQMSLYCLLAAPLIIGGDIREMDATALETLLNKEAIAINQDPLGVPGWRAVKLDEREVWKRPLAGGDYALGLLNRGQTPIELTATWRQLNLDGAYRVRDVWRHENLGARSTKITFRVKPHQTVLLRLSPVTD